MKPIAPHEHYGAQHDTRLPSAAPSELARREEEGDNLLTSAVRSVVAESNQPAHKCVRITLRASEGRELVAE